jgi:hypothetical protein
MLMSSLNMDTGMNTYMNMDKGTVTVADMDMDTDIGPATIHRLASAPTTL